MSDVKIGSSSVIGRTDQWVQMSTDASDLPSLSRTDVRSSIPLVWSFNDSADFKRLKQEIALDLLWS